MARHGMNPTCEHKLPLLLKGTCLWLSPHDGWATWAALKYNSIIPIERRVKSFADDFNTRWGIVSGRVALLPRSTKIHPCVALICPPSPPSPPPKSPQNFLPCSIWRLTPQCLPEAICPWRASALPFAACPFMRATLALAVCPGLGSMLIGGFWPKLCAHKGCLGLGCVPMKATPALVACPSLGSVPIEAVLALAACPDPWPRLLYALAKACLWGLPWPWLLRALAFAMCPWRVALPTNLEWFPKKLGFFGKGG